MYTHTADKFLVDSLGEILKNGMNTQNTGLPVRTKYADGEVANYISMGPTMVQYDIENKQLPVNSLRPFPWLGAINEIRWIYQKESNKLSDAEALGVNWWKSWDIGDGTIGLRYGETVRRYDLMYNLLRTFVHDPLSRRKMMSLWQEKDFIEDPVGLKPCAHTTLWDLNIRKDGTYAVTLTLYQRSMDLLVTSSINAFQYYILAEAVMAYLRYFTGKRYKLVKLRHDIGDVHIYDRHIPAAREIIGRAQKETPTYPPGEHFLYTVHAPNVIKSWGDWDAESFELRKPIIAPLEYPIEIAI